METVTNCHFEYFFGVGPIEKDKCAIFRKNCAIARDTRACVLRGLRAEKNKQNGVTFVGAE